MPITLSSDLSCFTVLKSELPEAVWAKDAGKSPTSNQVLRIGVINLMPTKEATERQWARLLAKQSSWIEPVFVQMGSYESKNTEQSYLEQHYIPSEELDLETLDGIILTGAPVEHLAFEEVDYWQELTQLITAVEAKRIPILAICWGAQSLLYIRHGIQKTALEKKCFGVFGHQVIDPKLKNLLGDEIHIPHSRHTTWQVADLQTREDLKILIESPEAGVFALEDEFKDWYFTGHVEYEGETLVIEYERDLAKGQPIEAPKGLIQLEDQSWIPENDWQETAHSLIGIWTDKLLLRIGA